MGDFERWVQRKDRYEKGLKVISRRQFYVFVVSR
jgi:hypothetical protein